MKFRIQTQEEKIFQLLAQVAKELNYPSFVIGGYVRDRILGRSSKDIDIVCVGSGIELAQRLASLLNPRPKVVVYKRFGTAMLRYGNLELEFVGARKESYRKESRKPTVENGTLEDDQNRRDFTINALAVSLNEENYGEIVDPFGGLMHLRDGIIKTPLAPKQTFCDDPLRMMRAIRLATQLNFKMTRETFQAIREQRERIKIISQERITTELQKIVATKKPSYGFKLLFDTGLLELIFPELYAMHGVEEREGQRHKDNFYHTLQVLDNTASKSNNIWFRWVAILHDIAKPLTKRFEKGQGWTFYGHEVLGAKMIPRILRKLRLPLGKEMKYIQKLVAMHQRPILLTKEKSSDSALRRLLFEAGDEIEDLLLFCECDSTSKFQYKRERYLQNIEQLRQKLKALEKKDNLRKWQPPISGEEIMKTFGLPPSRKVGVIKNAIREAILDGALPNNYQDAYQFMLKKGKELNLRVVG